MEKTFKNLLLVICAVLTGLGLYLFKVKESQPENKFRYDLDEYSQVDEKQIKYREIDGLSVYPESKKAKELLAITIDEHDNIYVSEKNSILVFDKGYRQIRSIRTNKPAHCMEAGGDGLIYADYKAEVAVYNQAGKVISKLKFDKDKSIITAICSTEDYVFVADAGTRKLKRFLKDKGNPGKFLQNEDIADRFSKFIIPSAYFDIKNGPNETIWVVNPGKHTLENYSYTGVLLTSWTRPSIKIEGFSGCCNPVHIAVGTGGNIFTSEKGINRIKEYSPKGELLGVVVGPQGIGYYLEHPDIAVNSSGVVFLLDNRAKKIRMFKRI